MERQQSLGILLVLAAGSVVPTSVRENVANLQHYKVATFTGLKYGDRLQLLEIHAKNLFVCLSSFLSISVLS